MNGGNNGIIYSANIIKESAAQEVQEYKFGFSQ